MDPNNYKGITLLPAMKVIEEQTDSLGRLPEAE